MHSNSQQETCRTHGAGASTKRASALLDELTKLKKCVTKDQRGIFHVQENCALHGVPRRDVSLQDETVVFTGFRDVTLAKQIEQARGQRRGEAHEEQDDTPADVEPQQRSDDQDTGRTAVRQIEDRVEFVKRFYQ